MKFSQLGRRAVVGFALVGGAVAPVLAAPTVPTAVTQLTAIQTSLGGYGTVMFAIALIATGIMVGVKWIKKGKSAT